MRERVLTISLISVLLLFSVYVAISHHNYMSLLGTNDSLCDTLNESKSKNEEIIHDWQMSYEQLQNDYGAKIAECEALKQVGVIMPKYSYTPAEVQMLAECVQCEAGVGNPRSQKYVCSVVLNRLASPEFPNTIEEVIYQKVGGTPQFSVAYNGMMEECQLSDEVLLNTYRVLTYGTDLPDYVMYFYSESVDENWVNNLNVYTTIEGTVFAYE